MKTTKKIVMKKPTVKKMAAGVAAKKMVKPKPLQKANLGMAMDSSGMDDSACYETVTDAQGRPGKRRRRKSGCGKKFKSSSRSRGVNNSPGGRGLFTG
jgi:hypothetical protein